MKQTVRSISASHISRKNLTRSLLWHWYNKGWNFEMGKYGTYSSQSIKMFLLICFTSHTIIFSIQIRIEIETDKNRRIFCFRFFHIANSQTNWEYSHLIICIDLKNLYRFRESYGEIEHLYLLKAGLQNDWQQNVGNKFKAENKVQNKGRTSQSIMKPTPQQ